MAVNLSPVGGVAAQFFDNSGNVLTGGKLLTYLAGTTTPAVTYTTSAGSIPQPNPIILNASGRVPGSGEIWLTDSLVYKFVLTDSNDVLIATYDNITGINSNFVNFTSEQEIQTATAGQTVFNLTTMEYQPGTNNLMVFVDGVNQYGPGAQYAYVETDGDTVTFVSGLHVGAEVKFTTATPINTLTANAAQVAFEQAGVGAIATTVQAKLRQYVNISDFGAAGDGVTNDTVPMTNFFNSAINNPGVPHRLNKATYCISSVMPTINVSNVIIEGEGADIHDTGVLITGTVIKWIASGSTVGPMIKISAVSGASNQRVSDVKFTGIGLDCNNGAIDYGIELLSIRDSQIDVAITNAGFAGMQTGVVAALGEAKDIQRCKIRLLARQIETPAAFCLICSGDATANTSLNEFWVDAQITNTQAIYLVNSDNNDWYFVRAFRASGGTATEGISCLGGANSSERSRGERFWYYTGTVGIHVYGTSSGSPTFAVGSAGHSLFCLDTENGTPAPTVEVGGDISWRKDVSGMSDNAWIQYTPTLSATSGTLTTAAANMYYIRRGNVVYFKTQIIITTNGSASGALLMTVPIPQVGSFGTVASGFQRAPLGYIVYGWLDGGGDTTMNIKFYDDTYPGADGAVIEVSGFYEVT
jgi:hypothetical protein